MTRRSVADADLNLTADRHEAVRALFRGFDESMFDRPLQPYAAEIAHTARTMVRDLPDCPELTVGLRKLLEARDCFVRAACVRLNGERADP